METFKLPEVPVILLLLELKLAKIKNKYKGATANDLSPPPPPSLLYMYMFFKREKSEMILKKKISGVKGKNFQISIFKKKIRKN